MQELYIKGASRGFNLHGYLGGDEIGTSSYPEIIRILSGMLTTPALILVIKNKEFDS